MCDPGLFRVLHTEQHYYPIFLAGNLCSHAVAGLWLWIAVVDVVCVMFGLGLMICGAVIGTKLSTLHLVLLSGTRNNQGDGMERLDDTAIHSERTKNHVILILPIGVILMVVVQLRCAGQKPTQNARKQFAFKNGCHQSRRRVS